MKQSFPPCPVCGGTQAFFNGSSMRHASLYFPLGLGAGGITLGALICLTCGHTELRPDPDDMGRLREAAQDRGITP